MTTTIRTRTAAATASPDIDPAIEVGGPRGVTLVPVSHRDRTVGAYIVRDGAAAFHPVVDVTRIVAWSLAATTATVAIAVTRRRAPAIGTVTTATVAIAVTRRSAPAIRTVTMGHGGWISLKGQPPPALRAATHDRPWWARLLRARRLVLQR